MNKQAAITDPPKGTRLEAKANAAESSRVDREGGMFRAGLIEGVSAVTLGEALGHDLWLDSEFIDQVVVSGNASRHGVKMRFTHPGLSSDGLGTLLARYKNFRRDGDKALADVHFVKSAHSTPSGDLASYVMDLAEESPDLFATSIVFNRDIGEEGLLVESNRNKDGNFISPDKKNTRNLLHARLDTLIATDMVDEPAANPDGLFSALGDGNVLPDQIARAIKFALRLTDDKPEEAVLGIHPDRMRPFMDGFCRRENLLMYRAANVDNEFKAELFSDDDEDWMVEVSPYAGPPGDEGEAGQLGELIEDEDRDKDRDKSDGDESGEGIESSDLSTDNGPSVNTGADPNPKERDSIMEDLKDLSAEELQEQRPELVEELTADVRSECDAEAEGRINDEKLRCAGIVEAALEVGSLDGVKEAIEENLSVEKATIMFYRSKQNEFDAGADAGADLKPSATDQPNKREVKKTKDLSRNEKIAARTKALCKEGVSPLDAMEQAEIEVINEEEAK
ncbi:MAG TPA: hypothetical protein VMX74_08440 [Pirellulales bacterium]|nr:hypothetical protein [Pirellulales bacterium]